MLIYFIIHKAFSKLYFDFNFQIYVEYVELKSYQTFHFIEVFKLIQLLLKQAYLEIDEKNCKIVHLAISH